MNNVSIPCICEDGCMPNYAHFTDAGADLVTNQAVSLKPRARAIVGSGVKIDVPEGYVALVFPRSGMASKQGVTLVNAVRVIDCGYHGEIGLPLLNVSGHEVYVRKGTRIAQVVLVPYAKMRLTPVEQFEESERGDGGFGSTGV